MRIKELRKIAGINQGELAQAMNVKQSSVSDWESGKTSPTIDNLISIARFFRVTVGCVLEEEPIPQEFVNSFPKQVVTEKKPKKEDPFTPEQIEYLNSRDAALIKKIVAALREDTFLSSDSAGA